MGLSEVTGGKVLEKTSPGAFEMKKMSTLFKKA